MAQWRHRKIAGDIEKLKVEVETKLNLTFLTSVTRALHRRAVAVVPADG